ncbi:hypothetical protein [Euzebya sp.]|uniref:hypothetical protein n=1 Tax=Euzebya sp. TaxID=1971409 RepID=UPI003515308A
MDDHDISDFIDGLDDAGGFAGRGTHEAAATPALLHQHRAGRVEDWLVTAVTALRDGMRDDLQPPVARGLLQTAQAVHASEAEPCCATEWFAHELRRRARDLPDVWVALAVPDLGPSRISTADWNPLNLGHGVRVRDMRWFVEIRGRGLGLDRGKLVRTGRTSLLTDGPVDLEAADDPGLMRLGRRVLRGHPVRRAAR